MLYSTPPSDSGSMCNFIPFRQPRHYKLLIDIQQSTTLSGIFLDPFLLVVDIFVGTVWQFDNNTCNDTNYAIKKYLLATYSTVKNHYNLRKFNVYFCISHD